MQVFDRKNKAITMGALVAVIGRIVRTPTQQEVTIKPTHAHAPPFYMQPGHVEVLPAWADPDAPSHAVGDAVGVQVEGERPYDATILEVASVTLAGDARTIYRIMPEDCKDLEGIWMTGASFTAPLTAYQVEHRVAASESDKAKSDISGPWQKSEESGIVRLPGRFQIGDKVSIPDPLLATPGDARVNGILVGILFRAAPQGVCTQYIVLPHNAEDVYHYEPSDVDSPVEEAPAQIMSTGPLVTGVDASTLDYAQGKEFALEGGTHPDGVVSEAFTKGYHDGCIISGREPTTQDHPPETLPPGHPTADMEGLPTEAEKPLPPLPPVEAKKDEGPSTEKPAE